MSEILKRNHLTINIQLVKGQEGKIQVGATHPLGVGVNGGERVNGVGEGRFWWTYFVLCIKKNNEGKIREKDGWVYLIKIECKQHI
jgi:hypothetical protein